MYYCKLKTNMVSNSSSFTSHYKLKYLYGCQTKEEAEDSGVCMQLIGRKKNRCVRKIRY